MNSDKPFVLYLIDGLQQGGAERSLLALCKELREFKPFVLVLAGKKDLLPEFTGAGIAVHHMGLDTSYNYWRMAKKVDFYLKSLHPAIVHSFLFHSDMTLRYLTCDIPKVGSLVSNSYSPRRLNQLPFLLRAKIELLKLWDALTASKLDLYIANSQTIKDSYQQLSGLDKEKIKVIYRGRDSSLYDKKQNKSLNKSQAKFVSVGRLIPSKGFDELIAAFSKLKKVYPQAQLQIAGDGITKDSLSKLIHKEELSSSVRLLGSVQDIPNLLETADFLVFPSHYEGLPGVLIEAMMAKVPIICSDIPENRECVTEEMALFHKLGDSDDIYNQLIKAISLEDWQDRVRKAHEYAKDQFEIGQMAKAYENTYHHLLNTFKKKQKAD